VKKGFTHQHIRTIGETEMLHSLTRTKIVLPRRPRHLLTRQRLLDILDEILERRLLLISAPAGYGKTSTLIDWACHTTVPVCWYALDELDRDPQQFLTYFIATIAQHFPDFGKVANGILYNTMQALDIPRLVQVLVNDIYENIQDPFVIVLDDYHLVSDCETITDFLNGFVRYMGENCHLVLASREYIQLPDLPLIIARSEVVGLDLDELSFAASELQAFVLQNYHTTLSDTAAADLIQETEGWITGMLLSAQTLWQGMADRVRLARASKVGVYDYMVQQVLDQQSPDVRDFLLRTALLEEFNAALCTAVLGPDRDWTILMKRVLQSNLFVLPVDNDGTWLRYHHLFRDFLQTQMQKEYPTAYEHILQTMAQVYRKQEQWAKAYNIYRRLADLNATMDLIECAGLSLIKDGRWALLAQWIDDLPAKALADHPSLLSLRGMAATGTDHVEYGLSLQNQAIQAFRITVDAPLLARALVRRAANYRLLGQYSAVLQDVDEALRIAENDTRLADIQAEAWRLRGMTLCYQGKLQPAIHWLEKALDAFLELNYTQNTAFVYMELGIATMNAGYYIKARRYYERALAYWQGIDNIVRQAVPLNNLGVLHCLLGDYEQASTCLDRALQYAQRGGYAYGETLSLLSIGDLYVQLSAFNAAQNAYQQAQQIVQRTHDRYLTLYLHLALATLACATGNTALGHYWIESARSLIPEDNSQYEKGLWHLGAGRQALSEKLYPGAVESLLKAVAYFDAGGQRGDNTLAHIHLAAAYQAMNDTTQAVQAVRQAFALAEGLESTHLLSTIAPDVMVHLESLQDTSNVGQQIAYLHKQVEQWQYTIPAIRRHLRQQPLTIPLTAPRYTFRALGDASVSLDNEVLSSSKWQRLAARDLLFCLLAYPDGLTKQTIGLYLWPDSSESQLRETFKKAMATLRQVLGSEIVLFEDERYRINPLLDYEYDVEVFQDKLKQARMAEQPQQWAPLCREAMAYYHGPYLPGVEGEWIEPMREQLHRSYVQAALRLITHYVDMAQYAQALTCCQQLLEQDECLEEGHRLAMRAYGALGDQAAVARQYQRCVDVLQQNLGVLPSKQTQALYAHLTR
jgi:LuxR family maltose regulon positive regulatory protein